MQDFFNKRSACQATVDYLNCEAFNISLSGVFSVIKARKRESGQISVVWCVVLDSNQ